MAPSGSKAALQRHAATRRCVAGPRAGLLGLLWTVLAAGGSGQTQLLRAVPSESFRSTDPAGLTYHSGTGRLFLTDSEVEEAPFLIGPALIPGLLRSKLLGRLGVRRRPPEPAPANLFELQLDGQAQTSFRTAPFSAEPTGVAYHAGRTSLFVTDDDLRQVFEVVPGGSELTVLHQFSTAAFGATDPEGITYDALTGNLFLCDGLSGLIHEVTPAGTSVGSFPVPAPIIDPEGIAHDAIRDEFLVVSGRSDALFRITRSGVLLWEHDLSWLNASNGPVQLKGITLAPTSDPTDDPALRAIYLANYGLDEVHDGQFLEIDFVSGAPPVSPLAVRISGGGDDAEERPDGSLLLASSDLELVTDLGQVQTVGLRFPVAVPAGATILSAHLQFTCDEVSLAPASLTIDGEAADIAATFADTPFNVSLRTRTSASIAWNPPPWPTPGAAGADQQTPDLSSIVQEIVNRPGWQTGHPVVFLISGTGRRTAESLEGGVSQAAMLTVEWE